MPKFCKDFTYNNRSMSDFDLVTVNVGNDDEIPLYLKRDIIKGETNRYKHRANHIGTTWSEPIKEEFYLVKKGDIEFSKDEIREITKWLTSVSVPSLLRIEDANGFSNYYGIFDNVDTFVVGNRVYGLILSFTNDSSFSYNDETTNTLSVNGYTSMSVTNDSDLLDDYCYPTIRIYPNAESDFFICNLSDATILKEGILTTADLDNLLNQIELYAATNSYTVEYYHDDSNMYITLADDTAIRVKYTDTYGNDKYCFAYFRGNNYTIIEGGFLSLQVLQALAVNIDCENLIMNDDLGRMILFERIGIEEEDYIYWPRLKSGTNSLLFYATNCDITIKHTEMIKAGAM